MVQRSPNNSNSNASYMTLAETRLGFADLNDQAQTSADAITQAFERAGDQMSKALQKAAQSGSLDFSNMVDTILNDLAKLAFNEIFEGSFEGLSNLAGSAIKTLIGQRAEGGPVLAGESYLVGERGPEVFVPPIAGAIQPISPAGPINVVIYAGEDTVQSVRRSQRQITAALARAAQAGSRSL